jgi:hypothetical protein
MEYRENKRIHNIGDLIDNIRFYMWFPGLNSFILIVVIVGIFIIKLFEFIMKLCKLSKFDVLLEKFINIKLR